MMQDWTAERLAGCSERYLVDEISRCERELSKYREALRLKRAEPKNRTPQEEVK